MERIESRILAALRTVARVTVLVANPANYLKRLKLL